MDRAYRFLVGKHGATWKTDIEGRITLKQIIKK
jgi:hypothetical protein